ncbi:MAG TPA: amino acid permease [Candidatus Acidoferrales bacterium]|nr:amino acid permease [Candidatus Acidoferrales bacterium]
MPPEENSAVSKPRLAARIGLFDATMIVMGGIIGSGIFINSYVVAQQVHTAALILGAWAAGGVVALLGAFIYAELAARLPEAGGQYAYLREAYHPLLAFLYGWVLLLVIQTGGMAAVAVTFAKYLQVLVRVPFSDTWIAAIALAVLAIINCLGVRAGSTLQSALMVLKILAIAALVVAGAWYASPAAHKTLMSPVLDRPVSLDLVTAIGAALTPVLFAYGGWQTANFVAAEIREPTRNLPRALILGVVGVIALYLGVNFVYVRVLTPAGLAATSTPATDVMRHAFGATGESFIALGITISTLGFLSQSVLTAPRVYFAMAKDGLFFRSVAWVDPRNHVPAVAILLQAAAAIVIAMTGRYEQILNYVVSMDFIFFGLTATCLFAFRRRGAIAQPTAGASAARARPNGSRSFRVPGHPFTTIVFIAISWFVVANTIVKYPGNTLVGMGILFTGIPIYFVWRRRGHSA